jgi:membrane protein HdeD
VSTTPTDSIDVDPPSALVGVLVGAGGLCFLLEPVIDPVSIFGTAIRPIALSAIFLTVGFGIGAVLYARRAARLIAIAHAVAAGGFGLLAAAMGVGSQLLLFGGVLLLVAGSAFLITQAR